jgi:hypothetical protein
VDAAFRQFPEVSEVGVISVDNECKELLLIFENEEKNDVQKGSNQPVFIKCFYKNQFQIFYKNEKKQDVFTQNYAKLRAESDLKPAFEYIVEPDVAFYKARFLEDIPPQYFDEKTTILTAANGFFLTNNVEKTRDFPSRIFQINAAFPYQPKRILAFLKAEKITTLNVVQRNFPFSAADIRTALKVKEGGDWFLICTILEGQKWAWFGRKYA